MLSRRHFAQSFLVLPLAALGSPSLLAQPIEGRHFQKLGVRQPIRDEQRVEVLEFFAYSCHHCHDFEPTLETWLKTLPADVVFRRIPVAFRPDFAIHNALFFALESLNLLDRLHAKVFEAVHSTKGGMKSQVEISAFLQSQSVKPEPVLTAMQSFSVTAKVKQAAEMVQAYAIEGTPTMAVHGRWVTDGQMAGSNRATLAVVDHLIGVARKR